jgi:glutathione S-transferase
MPWVDWDGPGKAEPARLAFAVKGVAFEDVLLTGSTWETLKPATPWGQVPVLEVDGEQLAQSGAINSYVARALGLCPADPMGAAKVDEFCDTVEECSVVCLAATYGKEVRVRLHLLLASRPAALGAELSAELTGIRLHCSGRREAWCPQEACCSRQQAARMARQDRRKAGG